jgi:hypothetical protein
MFYPRRSWPGISLVSSVHDGRVEVEPGVSVGYSLHLAGSEAPLIPLYTSLGINLLVADYRGYGWSDGLWRNSAAFQQPAAWSTTHPWSLKPWGRCWKRQGVRSRSGSLSWGALWAARRLSR